MVLMGRMCSTYLDTGDSGLCIQRPIGGLGPNAQYRNHVSNTSNFESRQDLSPKIPKKSDNVMP